MQRRSRFLGLLAFCGFTALLGQAQAFTHVVTEKDTLASIAERYYGRIQFE
jgi:hypothetical protein